MPKGSSKKPRKREDEAQAAVRVIDTVAAKSEEEPPLEITEEMREAARTFGRIGGKIGGKRRAEKLTPEERAEIAKRAAAKRWESNKR